MGRDNNNKNYVLKVVDIEAIPTTGASSIVLEFSGPLRPRTKKEFDEMIEAKQVKVREIRAFLA